MLFVGKPHRGLPGTLLPSGIIDPASQIEALWTENWAYWRVTRLIAEQLFGEGGIQHIALTNQIKCTNVGDSLEERGSTDRTTLHMAESCISQLGVIWEEVAILKPTHVVFYTFGLYRCLLANIPLALPGSVEAITSIDHTVQCGAKALGWWERNAAVPWTPKLKMLVVGHPERMQQQGYVDLIGHWLRSG